VFPGHIRPNQTAIEPLSVSGSPMLAIGKRRRPIEPHASASIRRACHAAGPSRQSMPTGLTRVGRHGEARPDTALRDMSRLAAPRSLRSR